MNEKEIFDFAFASNPNLYRNDNGMGYREDGSLFPYGLGTGTADLIGWTEIEITPDMIGKKIAVFTAIEGKTKNDRASDKQKDWLRIVREAGGIAYILKEYEHGEIRKEEDF